MMEEVRQKTNHFSVHGHQRGQTSRGEDGIMQMHQQDYILDPRFDILQVGLADPVQLETASRGMKQFFSS